MSYDPHDTIVALASAPGAAARGIVRLSGPRAVECVTACFVADAGEMSLSGERAPRRISGCMSVGGGSGTLPLKIPVALYLWPRERSFTRQPSAEIACIGSPPLLTAIVEELCRHGARVAEPGEFTMRAFLAGRIDLTQAEAVLGVVDARSREDLDAALDRLSGGLSRPLYEIRELLLATLAEVEAGLDFPDERLETAEREALRARLAGAYEVVAATMAQLGDRDRADDVPRFLLAGRPNVGKSRLFNLLVERHGTDRGVRSIVSSTPGATRDYVAARLQIDGVECELIDAAGEDAAYRSEIDRLAQEATASEHRRADVRLACVEAADYSGDIHRRDFLTNDVTVLTKCDLALGSLPAATSGMVACSAATGAGLDELISVIRSRLVDASAGGAAGTTARCASILRDGASALASAIELCDAGDDLMMAAEMRFALNALGEVVGAVCADDVLDRVFSQFCIGK